MSYDSDLVSAVTLARKATRDVINDSIDAAVPRLDLKKELAAQHKLLAASDTLLEEKLGLVRPFRKPRTLWV